MSSLKKKLIPIALGLVTAFNTVGGAHAQSMQEQYDAMPGVLQDEITGLGTQQNIQFDQLRPRDQRPSSFCDTNNQMVTQPLQGLFTAPNGELDLTPVGSGEEAVAKFQEMDANHAFVVNPNDEVVRIYMKDNDGKISVSRPLAAKPVGPSAQEALDCLSGSGANLDDVQLDTSSLNGFGEIASILKNLEGQIADFDPQNITMKAVISGEARPSLVCIDDNRDGQLSIQELQKSDREVDMFFFDKGKQQIFSTTIKNSHDFYKTMDNHAEWAITYDTETGNFLSFAAKDTEGNLLVNNNLPGFYGVKVAVQDTDGNTVYEPALDKDGNTMENKIEGGLVMTPKMQDQAQYRLPCPTGARR